MRAAYVVSAEDVRPLNDNDDDEGLITASFQPRKLVLEVGSLQNATIKFSRPLNYSCILFFNYDKDYVVDDITNVSVYSGEERTVIRVSGRHAGYVSVGINSTVNEQFYKIDKVFLHITVAHSQALDVFSDVIGWIYFLAWSISFYPQIYVNWTRKSVVGLNFDFLALNLIGFTFYSLFNIGLYFIPAIQDEYHDRYPRQMISVEINDVVFALHAVAVTIFCILQTCIYERNGQRVSWTCRVILCVFGLISLIGLIVVVLHKITWLSYLYIFSYMKLCVTLIKYVPQAMMNFRRKSTEGWSIGNVLLDFTGGTFSIFQMFILAFNTSDWPSIFGNPTKFGLGVFSIMFDILFMIQHYILYRHNSSYNEINADQSEHLH